MRILVSNDDGLYGYGLCPLIEELNGIGEVFAVVPDKQMSASSHSITIHRPIRLIEQRKNVYTVNGTPSDCVRFGIIGIMKNRVDLVVSGINDGANLGDDCIYSGTVAAAREGAMSGFLSVAVSLVTEKRADFKAAAKKTLEIIRKIITLDVPKRSFFNINIPDKKNIKGVKVTRMGIRIYDEDIEERKDPRGLKYYWMAGKHVSGYMTKGTDIYALNKGYISVTPLKIDQTDHSFYEKIQEIKI